MFALQYRLLHTMRLYELLFVLTFHVVSVIVFS